MARFPRMCDVIQRFETPRVLDLPGTIRCELERLNLTRAIRPGQSVAIPAGSRGIANIPLILREIASYFKAIGALPFIVPAMGSHGGGTIEGQLRMLFSLGITAESVGVPINAVKTCTARWCATISIHR